MGSHNGKPSSPYATKKKSSKSKDTISIIDENLCDIGKC